MKRSMKSAMGLLVLLGIIAVTMVCPASVLAKSHRHKFPYNPVIFVHGGAGSASQFESQAMRFATNGYPQHYLYALEYDSSFSIETMDDIHARLDVLIDDALAATGADQVDLMGHSLGTRVSQLFLVSAPERAARVAHYINIDGYPAAEPPGGVATLALWAGIGRGGVVEGALNVTIENQTHVQCATSAESFYEMYTFFTGKAPETTMVLPEPRGALRVAGRACLFPQNIGVAGATVEIYEVCGYTGKRVHRHPEAVYPIGEDGDWGPFKAKAGEHYEFVIVREGQDHHVYKEPFIRSDYFVRLQTSPVGGGIGANMDVDEGQSNLVVTRDKEFWGELSIGNDILAVNGVNVVNAADCPFSNRTTAIYLFDVDSDGVSYLDEPIAYFHSLPFMTGVDLYLPAADPPDGRIRLTLIPRGGDGIMQVINIPNWPSTTDRISVLFNDFAQWDNIPQPGGKRH